jgi:hypothetical protein
MDQSITYMKLDLTDSGIYRDTIRAMQGDNKTRFLYVSVLNDGEPYPLENIYPVFRGTKPDGTTVFNECNKVDGYIVVELTNQILAVPGIGHFEIALYNQVPDQVGLEAEGMSLATFPFELHIIKSSFNATNMVSSDEWTVIEAVIANLPILAELDDVTEFLQILDGIRTQIGDHTLRSDVPEGAIFTDTTYTISINPNDRTKVTLTDSDGNAQEVTIQYAADAGTVNNHTVLSDVPANAVFTDENTTYTISVDSNTKQIVLTDNSGNEQRISVPMAGDAATVNGHTVLSDVPANAVFTDTTYSPATSTTDGLMSSADKVKLDLIPQNADRNQNAISNVKVGLQTITATTPTDTVELVAGTNISLVPDTLQKSVTIAASMEMVHANTTAYWDAQPSLVGLAGHFYIYTDHDQVNGVNIPGLKAGDGLAYLIDAPFIDGNASALVNHINDASSHITPQERLFWNNKVSCYMSAVDSEKLVFTID